MSPLYYDVPDHKPSRFTETIQPVISMVPLHRPRFYITSITIKNCFQRMCTESPELKDLQAKRALQLQHVLSTFCSMALIFIQSRR